MISSSIRRRSTASRPTLRASRASATRACSACYRIRPMRERPGHTLSERIVGEAFTSIFSHAKGRIVVASFASNVPRIQQTVDHAVRFNRKVAFLGRSMRNVVHFAGELGHLRIPRDTAIKIEDDRRVPARARRRDDDRIAGRADERPRADVGTRSQALSHRSRRHGRHQRDADSRQREERSQDDQQSLQAWRDGDSRDRRPLARFRARVARRATADAQPRAAGVLRSGARRVPHARRARRARGADRRRSRKRLRR